MSPWLHVLETYLVQALLRTPAFHRAVGRVVKTVHRVRHGIPPDELGGTKLDQPGLSDFSKHFLEEVKTQMGRAEQKEANALAKDNNLNARGQRSNMVEEENADAVWQRAQEDNAEAMWQKTQQSGQQQQPKAGFLQEYMDALREQVRNQKNGR